MNDLLAALILGVLGAVLTLLLKRAQTGLGDLRLRRRFPVAGTFTTEYEDTEGEERVVRRAVSRLTQRGATISGDTTDSVTKRKWVLKGRVEPGGFMHGIYSAGDPHDTATGTFFLEVDGSKGDLSGLWAGYDSANRHVSGGRYEFRRCPDIKVRRASAKHARSVAVLLGEALGERYIELEALRALIEDERTGTCFLAENEPRRDLVGAATVSLLTTQELERHLPQGQEEIAEQLRFLRFHERVSILGAVAVEQEARRRGVATRLIEEATRWAARSGATSILSFGWKADGRAELAGVLNGQGFETVREVAGFWTEDSKERGYDCPRCGHPCTCSAVIFAKALAD